MRGLKVGAALMASRLIHVIKTRRGMKLPALFITREGRPANQGKPAKPDFPRTNSQAPVSALPVARSRLEAQQNPLTALDLHTWPEQCDALARAAIKNGGLSHDLCVELYSSGVDRALEAAHTIPKDVALQVANEIFDYRTPAERDQTARWNMQNGYCRHGITLDCCPLGCGSAPDD